MQKMYIKICGTIQFQKSNMIYTKGCVYVSWIIEFTPKIIFTLPPKTQKDKC